MCEINGLERMKFPNNPNSGLILNASPTNEPFPGLTQMIQTQRQQVSEANTHTSAADTANSDTSDTESETEVNSSNNDLTSDDSESGPDQNQLSTRSKQN